MFTPRKDDSLLFTHNSQTIVARPVFFDHVCTLFADHDDGGVGIATDNSGHHRCVDHPEPFDAVHSEPGIDDGVGVSVWAHFARARRMVYGEGEVSQGALPVIVAEQLELLAARHGRQQRPGVVLAERGRVGNVEREPDALDEHLYVLAVREIVGLDHGVHQRVFVLQPQPAGALGPQQQRQQHPRLGVHQRLVHRVVHRVPQPGDLADLIAVRVHRAGREVELNVREIARRVRVLGVDERQSLDAAGRQRAPLVHDVVHGDGRRGEPRLFERDRVVDDEREPAEADVVLQVVAHFQVVDDLDAHFPEMVGRPDAGHHEQLRRTDRSSRQYHLLAGGHHAPLAVPEVHDARGPGLTAAAPVEHYLGRLAVQRHVNVGPEPDRPEERFGRAAPTAPPGRGLRDHEPVLMAPVDVAVLVAQLLAGRYERGGQRSAPRRLGHGQVTALAVVLFHPGQVRVPVVLGLDEVRQHVLVTPAVVAGRLPAVVVPAVAPHVHHGVEHARAAQHFAARPVAPVVHHGQAVRVVAGRRRRFVLPVHVGQLKVADERRHVRYFRLVAARFQQQHRPVAHFRQPAGHHRPGRTRADHDEIVLIQHLCKNQMLSPIF